jgi:hypothetical protein
MALSEKQQALLDYLLDPRSTTEKGTQRELAERLGCHYTNFTKWKKDPEFREEWDRRLAEHNVSPDRVQRVLDALYAVATEGGLRDRVGAARLYLEVVGKYTPKQEQLETKRISVSALSDAELDALIQETARTEAQARADVRAES